MKQNPVMHMITPGRRALGEDWSKVTITPNENGSYDVEREATAAPAGLRPIYVPALGNISIEMADFILEKQRQRQKEQLKAGRFAHSVDMEKKIKQLWLEWMEYKVKMLEGRTISGPGGWNQRERISR